MRRRLPPVDIIAVTTITIAGSFANGAVAPLLGEVRDTFGLSYVALAFITGGFAIARVILDIPGGSIADRFSARPVFLVAGIAVVAGVMLTALSPSYPVLVAGRLLNGMGAIVGSIAATVYIARRVSPEHRGGALGGVTAASLLGGFLSPALVGAVASAAGWRWGVAITVVPALLSLMLVGLLVSETVSSGPKPPPRRLFTLQAFYAPRRMWSVYAVGTLVGLGTFGMKSTVLPLYGSEQLGLDPSTVGTTITIGAALGFPISIAAGMASDRFGRRAVFIPCAIILAAVGISINFATSLPTYVAVALGFSIDGATASAIRTMVVDRAQPDRLGAALGTSGFMKDLGMAADPFILGAIIGGWGFWGAGGMIAAAALAGVAAVLVAGETAPRHAAASVLIEVPASPRPRTDG